MKPNDDSDFAQQVNAKAMRKLRAHQQAKQPVWFGIGMLGIIGWSVVVPTLLGLGVGWWLDQTYPSHIAWTLNLLIIGLLLGCVNAWHWVAKEQRTIHRQNQDASAVQVNAVQATDDSSTKE